MKTLKVPVQDHEHTAVKNKAKSQGQSLQGYLRWLIWQNIPEIAPSNLPEKGGEGR